MIDGRRALVACAALTALGVTGCEDLGAGVVACARPETVEPWPYKGGTTEDGVYMSADWDGELLFFPGGAHYRIYHQLGFTVPEWYAFYLSFERMGLGEGSLAHASGNQVEVKGIDECAVTVLNGTCTEYWLLARIGVAADPVVDPCVGCRKTKCCSEYAACVGHQTDRHDRDCACYAECRTTRADSDSCREQCEGSCYGDCMTTGPDPDADECRDQCQLLDEVLVDGEALVECLDQFCTEECEPR